jgi:hypothetical protein
MVAEVYADVGIDAARIGGEDPEMDRVANKLAALVKAEARGHRASGRVFAASVIVQRVRGRRGVTERAVVATDPLAAAKEFGHVIRNQADGPELGYVRGMFTMARAIAKLTEVSGD